MTGVKRPSTAQQLYCDRPLQSIASFVIAFGSEAVVDAPSASPLWTPPMSQQQLAMPSSPKAPSLLTYHGAALKAACPWLLSTPPSCLQHRYSSSSRRKRRHLHRPIQPPLAHIESTRLPAARLLGVASPKELPSRYRVALDAGMKTVPARFEVDDCRTPRKNVETADSPKCKHRMPKLHHCLPQAHSQRKHLQPGAKVHGQAAAEALAAAARTSSCTLRWDHARHPIQEPLLPLSMENNAAVYIEVLPQGDRPLAPEAVLG